MNTVPIEVVDEPKVGTATWMIPPKVNEVFPYSEGAIWLGRNGDDARTPVGRKDESHVLLCAMNRAAKGRAIITNNLILWPGSVFCNDPKGENASVTAARRGQGSKHATKFLGQKVCVLDSHHTAKVEDRYRAYYNVLEDLDPTSSRTPARVENIVRSFFTESSQKDPTWDELAVAYMKALLLHIVTAPASRAENDGYIPARERDLITFRRMLQTGDYYAVRHIESVVPAEELAKKRPDAHMLLLKQMLKNNAFGDIIADEAANQLSNLKDQPKLWNSLRVSAGSATAWIDDPEIRDVLRAGKYNNTFRAEELETNPKGVSVYVCLKLEDQKRLAAWPRLITNMVLSAAQTEYFRSPATGHNTLMMLDEFAALERMKTIEQAAPAIAGAGIKLFMVLQNLSQMKAVYGDNFEAFMANAGTHIYYGFNDNFTAEYVKKRLGEIEVIRYMRSGSTATNRSRTVTNSTGGGTSHGTTSTSTKSKNYTSGTGGSSGSSSSYGDSSNVTHGWSPALFHMSLITSKQEGSGRSSQSGSTTQSSWQKSKSHGTSIAEGINETRSENWSRAVAEQQGETNTEGWTQQLHKKPLADIHELMQLFGTIDEETAPNFPGIGLVSTAEQAPALIQKCFYDRDRMFEGTFDPHPKHGLTPLPAPLPLGPPEPDEYEQILTFIKSDYAYVRTEDQAKAGDKFLTVNVNALFDKKKLTILAPDELKLVRQDYEQNPLEINLSSENPLNYNDIESIQHGLNETSERISVIGNAFVNERQTLEELHGRFALPVSAAAFLVLILCLAFFWGVVMSFFSIESENTRIVVGIIFFVISGAISAYTYEETIPNTVLKLPYRGKTIGEVIEDLEEDKQKALADFQDLVEALATRSRHFNIEQ